MFLGYLEYFLLLFLPGFALLTAFNQVKSTDFISVLARSYGLSLALNSLVVFAAAEIGARLFALPVVILSSSAGVIFGFALAHSSSIVKRPLTFPRTQFLVLLLAVLSGSLILSQFIKYPIFPKTFSVDFIQHVQIVRSILNNNGGGSPPLFYYGVHYNLALGYILVGGDAFVQIQVLMAILVAPFSLLVYDVVKRIYNNSRFALLGQGLFIATGFTWYVPLYDTGLYPNLFSVILSLGYLAELNHAIEGKGRGRFITMTVSTFALALLSHYFTPVFLAAVVITLLLAAVAKLKGTRQIVVPLLITITPFLFLLTRPDFLSFAIRILGETRTIGSFTYTTPLAEYLSFNPFLRYLVAEVYNYGALMLILGLPLSLYYIYRNRKDAWVAFALPFWILILWVFAPNGELSWRFSFQALTSFVLLAPAQFDAIVRSLRWLLFGNSDRGRGRRTRSRPGKPYSLFDGAALAILVLIVFSGSWTNVMVNDVASDPNSYSGAQLDLYNSMLWFSSYTPRGSSLLSVTDWRISFLQVITGRDGQVVFLAPATEAIHYAKTHGYDYLLVSSFIPASVPPAFDLDSFYGSFVQNQSLKMVYRSGQDVIYQIVK